jgi:hypothetical protein
MAISCSASRNKPLALHAVFGHSAALVAAAQDGRGLRADAGELAACTRLNTTWALLLANVALQGAAVAWLFAAMPSERATVVDAAGAYVFVTSCAHDIPMRMRSAFVVLDFSYLDAGGTVAGDAAIVSRKRKRAPKRPFFIA